MKNGGNVQVKKKNYANEMFHANEHCDNHSNFVSKVAQQYQLEKRKHFTERQKNTTNYLY